MSVSCVYLSRARTLIAVKINDKIIFGCCGRAIKWFDTIFFSSVRKTFTFCFIHRVHARLGTILSILIEYQNGVISSIFLLVNRLVEDKYSLERSRADTLYSNQTFWLRIIFILRFLYMLIYNTQHLICTVSRVLHEIRFGECEAKHNNNHTHTACVRQLCAEELLI